MSGWRSSHWPWNASAPPMPVGPTMSGGFPDAIWVASASRAPSYGTASNVRWMFGWEALNSSTTCCSTSTCSGASPPPRQQYQRSSTTSPLPAGCDAGGAAERAGRLAGPGCARRRRLAAGSDEQGGGRYQNQQPRDSRGSHRSVLLLESVRAPRSRRVLPFAVRPRAPARDRSAGSNAPRCARRSSGFGRRGRTSGRIRWGRRPHRRRRLR